MLYARRHVQDAVMSPARAIHSFFMPARLSICLCTSVTSNSRHLATCTKIPGVRYMQSAKCTKGKIKIRSVRSPHKRDKRWRGDEKMRDERKEKKRYAKEKRWEKEKDRRRPPSRPSSSSFNVQVFVVFVLFVLYQKDQKRLQMWSTAKMWSDHAMYKMQRSAPVRAAAVVRLMSRHDKMQKVAVVRSTTRTDAQIPSRPCTTNSTQQQHTCTSPPCTLPCTAKAAR